MNLDELKVIASELNERPKYGKRVFAWVGSQDKLYAVLPSEITKPINISGLQFHQNSEDVKRDIRNTLNNKLQEITAGLRSQQILVVEDAVLLARYGVEITGFYDWYVGDKTMVIFLIPDLDKAESRMQDICDIGGGCIEFKKEKILRYFGSHIGDENIIKEVTA